jgi:hypothetical protein
MNGRSTSFAARRSMLDSDLVELYQVETKPLNSAVRRATLLNAIEQLAERLADRLAIHGVPDLG